MEPFRYEEIKYFLTVRETAHVLNVSVDTIYRLIEDNKIAVTKISQRKTMISAEELHIFMRNMSSNK